MRSRRSLALPLVVLGVAVCAGQARADLVLGSDLSGQPTQTCAAPYDCTLTQLDPDPHSATVVAPAGGYILDYAVNHAANQGGDIPAVSLRILSGGNPFTTTLQGGAGLGRTDILSRSSGIERFAFTDDYGRPRGIPIAQGQRIAVYTNSPGLPLLADGKGAAEYAGNFNDAGAFTSRPGSLLAQATFSLKPGGDPAATPPHPIDTTRPTGEIAFFRAQEIPLYHATQIKPYKSKVNLYDALVKLFSTPISCSLPCYLQANASINWALYGLSAAYAKAKPATVAATWGSLPGAGAAQLGFRLDPKARKRLARLHRTVKMTVTYTAWDGLERVRRTQTVTLAANRR